jgi:photosystem II stability/assembly factor-like uncharacterized protein
MGDIALAPSDDKTVWVGTGENNSSRSSYAGAGVYKSTDAGKTWQFMGLDFTQHIGRIVIHPTNPQVVWVASIGSLYSQNTDRGVYKTTDGGSTWKKTLYINDSTGVIDLMVNPQNPDQLWAASWQRQRNAGNFVGNGKGSAIFISNDGGEAWSKSMQGFPDGANVGRIGLDICLTKPNIVYAILDNQELTKKEEKKEDSPVLAKNKNKKEEPVLQKEQFKTMSKEAFLNLTNAQLDTFLIKNNFPKKYTATLVKEEVRKGKYVPKALFDYFGEASDANEALLNTKVKGAEIYRSDDSGKTWRKVNTQALDGVFNTYGYYFGQIRVAPDNPDKVYVFGVPLITSTDGGKTFTLTDTIGNVHADHHALWINPKDPDHLLEGNDGGVNLSYDGGKSWSHLNNTSVGQFYAINVDMEKPYNIYGGLQDNGVYYGSSQSIPGKGKDWESLLGGDGMLVAIDPRNNNVVYTGFQYGYYFKLTKGKKGSQQITPRHDIGEAPLRFNWRTPVVMSLHNPDILYFGSQRLHRSLDGAQTWEAVSPDLTKNKKQGNVPFSTLTVIAESPVKFGLIYAGTDDGNIQVTRNGGASWELVSGNLPQDRWISSIQPSRYDEATVFATLNGYRYDDFKAYLYKSTDYGKTWESLQNNLPNECLNVVVQDPVNPDLLYVGSDHGTYISLNGGSNWQFVVNVPNVANYDMMVHPRDNELVIGTHGRSIYVMDVKPLQALKDGQFNKAITAFTPTSVKYSQDWGKPDQAYIPVKMPDMQLLYFNTTSSEKPVTIQILNSQNEVIRRLSGSGEGGFQSVNWDLKTESAKDLKQKKSATLPVDFVKAGTYKARFTNGKETAESQITIQ